MQDAQRNYAINMQEARISDSAPLHNNKIVTTDSMTIHHCQIFYPRDVLSAVFATATWLAGWLAWCLSVTRQYCIKTAKPILKHFRPSGSPIILVSSDPCADTKFQGEPLQSVQFSGGYKYTGVGKIGDFRRISPFISELVRDRPMVTMER